MSSASSKSQRGDWEFATPEKKAEVGGVRGLNVEEQVSENKVKKIRREATTLTETTSLREVLGDPTRVSNAESR